MSIAGSSGYNFALPGAGNAYDGGAGFIGKSQAEIAAEQAQFQPAQGQAILPNVLEEVAQIEGVTDAYYDTYGKLKSFVESMNKRGIDVTVGDYSQPGGGIAHKTYKKLEADLLQTANLLKDQQRKRKMMEPLVAQDKVGAVDGFDPSKQYLEEGSYFSKELSDRTRQALEIATKPVYTDSDFKRQTEFLDKEKKNLEKAIGETNDPRVQAQLKYELQQLTQAFRQTDLPSIRPKSGREPQEIKLLKEPIAVAMGGSAKYQPVINEETGRYEMRENSMSGKPFGETTVTEKRKVVTKERILDYFRLDQNGQVYAVFKKDPDLSDEEAEAFADQRVDNMSPATLAAMIGPNYGTAANAKLLTAVAALDTEYGTSTNMAVLGDEFDSVGGNADTNRIKLAELNQKAEATDKLIDELYTKNTPINIGGKEATIKRNKKKAFGGAGWELSDYRDDEYTIVYKDGTSTVVPRAKLISILEKNGYEAVTDSGVTDW
jgi:hypothetical protein